ncbi:hypothetical protein HBI26_238320 [Parastagonospora nodorum]|nr:hypothetical protein HBI26_238320 [Parastagonospora nodorum]
MGDEDEAWLLPNEDHPPAYYLQQLENFDEQEYTKEDYKDSSTRLLDRMEDQWNQCWTYLKRDKYRDWATVSLGTLHTFFNWLLIQPEGKKGRKRRGTNVRKSNRCKTRQQNEPEHAQGTKDAGKGTQSEENRPG